MNLSKIFEQLAKKVQGFSNDDIARIEKGNFKISIVMPTTHSVSKIKKLPDIAELMIKLENSTSRTASFEILVTSGLTVTELGKLSKKLEIPYTKGIKKEQLINKIIEKTIGFRLNSEAVRGRISE